MLAKAGVVLRFNGMVYLRPQEVSELVYKVFTPARHLPQTRARVYVFKIQNVPSRQGSSTPQALVC